MAEPKIAQKGSYKVAVEAGKEYWWCRCGASKTQPFCDGAHQGSEFAPLQYIATESKTVSFCGCKRTGTPPMCDGTHRTI